jgi:glycosyltransferase involved in cell wall biosynthesis
VSDPRVLFVVNDAPFFLSHRLPVAIAARDAGYEVHVATPACLATREIAAHGLRHHPISLTRSGTNPLVELASLWRIGVLFRALRPNLVHLVTPKPVLYGGIAARLVGVDAVVAAISGLGHLFSSDSVGVRAGRPLVTMLYRLALRRDCVRVLFQNPSDRELLLQSGAVAADRAVIIRGAGVDLSGFDTTTEPEGIPTVTFAARLLRPKGVYEFVEAARRLRAEGIAARFQLAGDADPSNPTSVRPDEIERWRAEGYVEVLGHRLNIAGVFSASHLIVLPSYYGEGLPKVLAEAAAAGRAVVTTDVPGCRDAIEPGVSGLLVPPRDATALARAIRELLGAPERRRRMGAAGRALAERDYGIERIVAAHLDVYRELLGV